MLSDEKLWSAYRAGSKDDHEVDTDGLRAVAEAAVKDAVGGGEPAAVVDASDDGWFASILPDTSVKLGQLLYTRPQASAAVPDLSACFMTAESGGGEYKIVMRFQALAKMQDAHSAMVHWLAASQPEVKS